MTVEQTVEIPASRRMYLKVPENVPVGKINVIYQFPSPSKETAEADDREQTIEECLAEADAKAQYYIEHPGEDRYYDGKPFTSFGETMEEVAANVRKMRSEWN